MNDLNLNIQRLCTSFLTARDLVTLRIISNTYFDEINLLEWAWQQLCERRWRDIRNSKRIANAKTWRLTYQTLSRIQWIPRGFLTEPHCAVLGSGMGHLSRSWLLLSHTTDCRPRQLRSSISATQDHRYSKYVVVHLCIQNIDDASSMRIDLSKFEAIVAHRHTEDMKIEFVQCWNPRFVAYNGSKFVDAINSSTSASSTIDPIASDLVVVLQCFEFAVISLHVGAGDEVANEIDFLVQLAAVNLSYTRIKYHRDRNYRTSIASDRHYESPKMLNATEAEPGSIIESKTCRFSGDTKHCSHTDTSHAANYSSWLEAVQDSTNATCLSTADTNFDTAIELIISTVYTEDKLWDYYDSDFETKDKKDPVLLSRHPQEAIWLVAEYKNKNQAF